VDIQFSQQHLLKRMSFSPSCVLGSFVKDQLAIAAWIYVWVFYSNPLFFMFVFVVPNFKESIQIYIFIVSTQGQRVWLCLTSVFSTIKSRIEVSSPIKHEAAKRGVIDNILY
jgi:hypothetical protein